jgi:CheY-like chemotaxis protein
MTATENRSLSSDADITFLVVEDEVLIARIIRNILRQSFPNCSAIEAQNGKEALFKLSKQKVDCIVSDINMPVMSGIEFLREVKKSRDFAQIPFIIVSGELKPENIVQAGMEGADGYICKPFSQTVFEQKVKEAWNKKYNPNNLESKLLAIDKAVRNRNFKSAVEIAEEFLFFAPTSARVWALKGEAELGLGHLEEAESSLNRAVAENPSYVRGQELLGNVYLERGDTQSAKSHLETVAAISPLHQENHVKLAKLYIRLGKINAAELVCANINRLFSHSAAMLAEVAESMLKEGHHQAAERVFGRSIEVRKRTHKQNLKELVHNYKRLGMALRLQGKFAEAIGKYQEALHLERKNPDLYFNLAIAQYKMGEANLARESLRRALELEPDFEEARQLLKELGDTKKPKA